MKHLNTERTAQLIHLPTNPPTRLSSFTRRHPALQVSSQPTTWPSGHSFVTAIPATHVATSARPSNARMDTGKTRNKSYRKLYCVLRSRIYLVFCAHHPQPHKNRNLGPAQESLCLAMSKQQKVRRSARTEVLSHLLIRKKNCFPSHGPDRSNTSPFSPRWSAPRARFCHGRSPGARVPSERGGRASVLRWQRVSASARSPRNPKLNRGIETTGKPFQTSKEKARRTARAVLLRIQTCLPIYRICDTKALWRTGLWFNRVRL